MEDNIYLGGWRQLLIVGGKKIIFHSLIINLITLLVQIYFESYYSDMFRNEVINIL